MGQNILLPTSYHMQNFQFTDLKPEQPDPQIEILAGLQAHPKYILPKYFYNERGAELFVEIVQQPEYYPPDVEAKIIGSQMAEIRRAAGEQVRIIEPGAGDCQKIRQLLKGMPEAVAYVPIEISAGMLETTARDVARDFPLVNVHAVAADYTKPMQLPADALEAPLQNIVFFPGSSIGNYPPARAVEILKLFRALAGNGGKLLIGVDLKKDPAVLEAAYNDAAGITAAFNLNALHNTAELFGTTLPIDKFRHKAFYNEERGRIEMHLEATEQVSFTLNGHPITLAKGETIHTESSNKYTTEEFRQLGEEAGYGHHQVFTDPEALFSVHLFS
mgnify:CR=1 FL=1